MKFSQFSGIAIQLVIFKLKWNNTHIARIQNHKNPQCSFVENIITKLHSENDMNGDNKILMVDWRNHRIQKFTSDGQFLAAVGTRGDGPLLFSVPGGITVNSNNNKVSDVGNNHVQVLNSDLTLSGTFGKKGSGMGQFYSPMGVACDSTSNVYVVDCENHRVQVFTA